MEYQLIYCFGGKVKNLFVEKKTNNVQFNFYRIKINESK
jgi:hypothetical protein